MIKSGRFFININKFRNSKLEITLATFQPEMNENYKHSIPQKKRVDIFSAGTDFKRHNLTSIDVISRSTH